MRRLSKRTTKPEVAEGTARTSRSSHATARRIVVLGVLFTAIVVAYFYAADHSFLSTRRMTPIFRYLLLVDDSKTGWLTLGVCIAAALWKNPLLLKVIDFVGLRVTTVVTATVALLVLGAVFIYHDNAFSLDEYAAVFLAKIFAAARRARPLAPVSRVWVI